RTRHAAPLVRIPRNVTPPYMIVGTVRIVRPATSLASRDKFICSLRSDADVCRFSNAVEGLHCSPVRHASVRGRALKPLGLFQQIGEGRAQLALEQLAPWGL